MHIVPLQQGCWRLPHRQWLVPLQTRFTGSRQVPPAQQDSFTKPQPQVPASQVEPFAHNPAQHICPSRPPHVAGWQVPWPPQPCEQSCPTQLSPVSQTSLAQQAIPVTPHPQVPASQLKLLAHCCAPAQHI